MKKTVVFDLDSTLAHCFFIDKIENLSAFEKLKTNKNYDKIKDHVHKCQLIDCMDKDKKGVGKLRTVVVFLRPNLKELLKTISKKYEIDIWSAGEMRYVWMLNHYIFSSHYNVRNIYSKRDTIITNNAVSKNLKSKNYDISNTVIVDDRPDVCLENQGYSINIPRFEPNVFDPSSFFETYFRDNSLITLRNFLDNCQNFTPENLQQVF